MSLPETNYLLHAFKPERVEVASGVLSKQRLVVSDSINVKGAVTGIGVPDWCVSHEEAKNDALVVSTLLQSGCRLVGKAQVDDFGTSISGQNPFLARLTNSMSPGARVGGSSSGAALAIVNGKATIAVGNAVCGGILIPAAYCGLFGYRPSLGMVDLRGMASLSPSFDAVGFMARSLPTLQQIAEKCWTKPARPVRLNAVKYASSLFQELLDIDALLEWEMKLSSLNFMRNDVPNLSKLTLTQAHNIHTAILGREIDMQYGQWLDAHNPRFSDETGTFLKTIRDKGFKEYVESKKKREFFSDSLQGFFSSGEVLMLPTSPGPAPSCDDVSEVYLINQRKLYAIAEVAGLAQLTVPAISIQGALMGVSLLAHPGEDRLLFEAAGRWFV